MEPTFTAWTKIALRLIFSLSLFLGGGNVIGQPVQENCSQCGVGDNPPTCYCCDDGDSGGPRGSLCDCILESADGNPNGVCDSSGYPTPVCANSQPDAEAFCDNGYNPIPVNQNLIILLFAGAFLGLTLIFNPRSLFS